MSVSIKAFFIVLLMNCIHASAWVLLRYLYDNDMACSLFIFLQYSLNFSAASLVSKPFAIFLGKPYSAKMILQNIIN